MAQQLHDLLLSGMDSQTPPSVTPSPHENDAESKMRRNLGLDGGPANGSSSSSSNDPLKMARQAIRSQVTAREYTERQLSQAQGTIQDLRTRLRHVHQERETAINSAQSAMAAMTNTERNMRTAESALATERATRVRIEGMLRDAETTIRDLREKLATANQNLRGMQAELEAERQDRQVADDAGQPVVTVTETVVAPIRDAAAPTVRRPVGRPRKIVGAPVEALIQPLNEHRASSNDEALSNRDVVAPTVRRPMGSRRKAATVQQVRKSTVQTASVGTKKGGKRTDDQEPVQWWVEGWKRL